MGSPICEFPLCGNGRLDVAGARKQPTVSRLANGMSQPINTMMLYYSVKRVSSSSDWPVAGWMMSPAVPDGPASVSLGDSSSGVSD